MMMEKMNMLFGAFLGKIYQSLLFIYLLWIKVQYVLGFVQLFLRKMLMLMKIKMI
jgi:hypothetical protein